MTGSILRSLCLIMMLVVFTAGFTQDAFSAAGAPTPTPTPAPATGGSGVQVGTGGTGSTVQTGTGQTTAPENCDWSGIKESLFGTESKGSGGCTASNSIGARGKYQFIPTTAATYLRKVREKNPGCYPPTLDCSGANLNTAACCGVQECMMDQFLADNTAYMNKNCQGAIGMTVTSKKYGKTCSVTQSGLLAAMHLGGAGACNKVMKGLAEEVNDGKTTLADYICKHGGIGVPGNACVPEATNSQTWVTGTQQQVDENVKFGDLAQPGPPDPLKDWWVAGLQLMAEQFTINMMMQVEAIGTLLDAKHQLETQRLLQEKMAEAHRDYQPSEQVCTFSTFAKDLASTQRTADVTKIAISNEILQRELGEGDAKSPNPMADSLSRVGFFRKTFCNPNDVSGGLKLLCPTAAPADMQNRDINYTATLDLPLSLEINMTDTNATKDEQAVFALIDNLFMNKSPLRPSASSVEQEKFQYHYLNYRSIVAMRGIARNTIANIIALKTQTPVQAGVGGSAPYMRRLLLEFGLQPEEIEKMLGENPSYYAQMELLTKKLYQSPNFYSALYDKPANVKRIRAAMQAVKLMQDRDIQAALQRREMLLSLMLELRLREKSEDVYNATDDAIYK